MDNGPAPSSGITSSPAPDPAALVASEEGGSGKPSLMDRLVSEVVVTEELYVQDLSDIIQVGWDSCNTVGFLKSWSFSVT